MYTKKEQTKCTVKVFFLAISSMLLSLHYAIKIVLFDYSVTPFQMAASLCRYSSCRIFQMMLDKDKSQYTSERYVNH